jgi:hypothetical protein
MTVDKKGEAARGVFLMADTSRASGQALVRAYVLWAEQRPEQWNSMAHAGADVFVQRFPCPK